MATALVAVACVVDGVEFRFDVSGSFIGETGFVVGGEEPMSVSGIDVVDSPLVVDASEIPVEV